MEPTPSRKDSSGTSQYKQATPQKGSLGNASAWKVLCHFCEQEPGVCRCHDCNALLCERCRQSHAKIPSTSNHSIERIADTVARHKLRLCDEISRIDQTDAMYKKTRDGLLHTKSEVDKKCMEISQEIDSSEESIKEVVKFRHDQLREKLSIAKENEKQGIDQLIAELDSAYGELTSQKGLLKEMANKTDDDADLLSVDQIDNLTAKSQGKCESFQVATADRRSPEDFQPAFVSSALIDNELAKITLDMSKISSFERSPENGDTMEQTVKSINAKMTDPRQAISEHAGNLSFPDFFAQKLEATQVCDSGFYENDNTYIESVAIVGKDIWCVNSTTRDVDKSSKTESNIVVLTYDPEKNIFEKNPSTVKVHDFDVTSWGTKFQTNYYAKRVVLAPYGDIIVACDGISQSKLDKEPLGLLKINTSGLKQCVLSAGRYTDVCVDKQFLYGLTKNGRGSFVTIHNYTHNGWGIVHRVTLSEKEYIMCSVRDNMITLAGLVRRPLNVPLFGARTTRFTLEWYDLGTQETYNLSSSGYLEAAHTASQMFSTKKSHMAKIIEIDDQGNTLVAHNGRCGIWKHDSSFLSLSSIHCNLNKSQFKENQHGQNKNTELRPKYMIATSTGNMLAILDHGIYELRPEVEA